MTNNELREAARNLDDTITALIAEIEEMATDYALKAQLLDALNITAESMTKVFRLAYSDDELQASVR